ncbi:hypothetical protein BDR03DRAFT_973953 [Suillus americanus]|nr:hypothetical protein BDR03DRAFT_973953 [Suillus americanus]
MDDIYITKSEAFMAVVKTLEKKTKNSHLILLHVFIYACSIDADSVCIHRCLKYNG